MADRRLEPVRQVVVMEVVVVVVEKDSHWQCELFSFAWSQLRPMKGRDKHTLWVLFQKP